MNLILIKYLLFFLGTLVFSLLLNKIFLTFSKNLGIRNQEQLRWSSVQKPAIGGVSFFIIFLLCIALYPALSGDSEGLYSRPFYGVILATCMGFLMGLADDAYNTKPLLKLFTQIACGVALVVTGTQIEIFSQQWLNIALTILWVVTIMNSLNMLDNMDGITTIVSSSILITILLILLITGQIESIYTVMAFGIIASLFAFLRYNWNPSKMYMGDTGSQFLGILLAALGIKFLWNPVGLGQISIMKQVFIVLITFLPTLVDTTTVIINRVAKGNSPFIGGKDHTTHFLSYLGFTDKQVAVFMLVVSLIGCGLVYFIVTKIDEWTMTHTVLFSFYCIIVFSFLFTITRLRTTNFRMHRRIKKRG